jgi:hypothetical protein
MSKRIVNIYVASERAAAAAAFSWAIRAGQDDGSIRNDVDPQDAAAVVMGMARGIAGLSLNQPDIADTDGVRQLCGRAIIELLQPTRKKR